MSYQAQQAIEQKLLKLSVWYANLKATSEFPGACPVIYEGNATGLSQYHYRDVHQNLVAGHTLDVRPHPENKYDANATGLYHRDCQIGWVPKMFNDVCAQALRDGHRLTALITKHNPHSSDLQNILFVEIRVAAKKAKADQWTPEQLASLPAAKPMEINKIRGNNPGFVTFDECNKATSYEPVDCLINPKHLLLTSEGLTMSKATINSVVEKNISLGTSAAFLEAGRIANNQLSSIAGKKLPIMVRAYADTALGRLLLANVALMARDHFRPDDERLGKLVNAMTVAAYQEVLQNFDVEQMIEDLISNSTIKKALKSIDTASAKE